MKLNKMKPLVSILSIIISILLIMKCFALLNKGAIVLPLVGVVLIYLIIYFNIKTRLFTKFKNNKKE